MLLAVAQLARVFPEFLEDPVKVFNLSTLISPGASQGLCDTIAVANARFFPYSILSEPLAVVASGVVKKDPAFEPHEQPTSKTAIFPKVAAGHCLFSHIVHQKGHFSHADSDNDERDGKI